MANLFSCTVNFLFVFVYLQFYLPSSMFVCLSWLSFYVDIDSVVGRVYFAVFLVVTMVGQVGGNSPAILFQIVAEYIYIYIRIYYDLLE